MKKRFVAAALAVATAVPAFALESNLTGFFRVKGIMEDIRLMDGSNKKPDWLVDQRLRAKWTGKVNDYLSLVYFGEIDMTWGDMDNTPGVTGQSRNNGGGFGADSVNLETKNLYMVAKLPNTPIAATIGLQGAIVDGFEGIVSNPAWDMAGVRFDVTNVGGIGNLTAAWFKLHEGEIGGDPGTAGGTVFHEDDVNLYALQLAMKPMGALKLGADFYYLQNQHPLRDLNTNVAPVAPAGPASGFTSNPGREDLYYLGANAAYKAGAATLSGFALYNFGKMHNGHVNPLTARPEDVDVSAWVASAKAAMAGKGWGAGFRGIYWTADKDATDKKMGSIRQPMAQRITNEVVPTGGAFVEWLPFGGEGLNLMLPDASAGTTHVPGASATNAGSGLALGDAAMRGYGLIGAVANGVFSPAGMPDLYVRGAAGYFQALKDDRKVDNVNPNNPNGPLTINVKDHDGKVIGTELCVRVGYKIAKNLDVSLTGAQAWLGDFYKKTAGKTKGTLAGAGTPGVGNDPNDNPPANAGTATSTLFGNGLAGTQNKRDPDNPYIVYWMANLTF